MKATYIDRMKSGKAELGQCWACPYYQAYGNYCDYYKMELNGNGYEPTCRNVELTPKSHIEINNQGTINNI